MCSCVSKYTKLIEIASLVLAMTSLLVSSPVSAAPADLGEIEVSAPDSTTKYDSTASSQIITPEDKEIKTTTQIIEKMPGIHVKRYGSSEDSATISIRGAPPNQVSTYYDNVPLNGAVGNSVDLSITPPENIDRIEVYRGGAPGRAADPAPSGAIFLTTPKRPDKFKIRFSNTYGSFNTYRGNIQVTQPFEKAWYLVLFEHGQSEGDFTYKDNNGTWTNPDDDHIAKRKNNNYTSENLLTKFGWSGDILKIEASNTLLLKREGVPGLGTFQSTKARLDTDHNVTVVNATFKKVQFTTFFDYMDSRFKDPNGDIGLGVQNNSDFTYRFGEEVSDTFQLGEHNKIFGSISHRGEYFQPNNYAATNTRGETSSRQQIGLVGEDTVSLFSERLTLIPSLRLTTLFNHLSSDDPSQQAALNYKNDKSDYQISGKFGAKYRLVSELYFKGNFYRGFRNPNFMELFGDRGAIVGNPTLKPERSINFDAGLLYDLGKYGPVDRFRVECTYFRNDMDDLIQYLQTSQFTAKPQNLASAVIQGFEGSVQLAYLNHISHSVSYTYQDARDTSKLATHGNQLPGRPRHEVWIDTSIYNDLGKLFGEYNFISGNFLDSQNIVEITGRNLLNVGVSATPKKWVIVNFTVKNLINDRTFDVIGFPLPGRSYWGALTFNI